MYTCICLCECSVICKDATQPTHLSKWIFLFFFVHVFFSTLIHSNQLPFYYYYKKKSDSNELWTRPPNESNQKKIAFCHVPLMNIRNLSKTLQSMREQIKMERISRSAGQLVSVNRYKVIDPMWKWFQIKNQNVLFFFWYVLSFSNYSMSVSKLLFERTNKWWIGQLINNHFLSRTGPFFFIKN